jgi:hypothetical protein
MDTGGLEDDEDVAVLQYGQVCRVPGRIAQVADGSRADGVDIGPADELVDDADEAVAEAIGAGFGILVQ